MTTKKLTNNRNITAALTMMCAFPMMVVIALAMMLAVCSIPTGKLRPSLEELNAELLEEPPVGQVFSPLPESVDNFTVMVMGNVNLNVDSREPLQSAMLATTWRTEEPSGAHECRNPYGEGLDMQLRGQTDQLICDPYGRYWHGYMVPMRPLLTVMPYRALNIFNIVVLGLLAVASIVVAWRRCGKRIALLFIATLLFLGVPVAGICFQYMWALFTMLAASLVVLAAKRTTGHRIAWLLFFMAVGGATSFGDFLTFPIVTLGIPLLLYMARCGIASPKEQLLRVAVLSAAWAIGYFGLWAAKWVLVELLTDYPMLANAIESVDQRTGWKEVASIGGLHQWSYRGYLVIFCTALGMAVLLWLSKLHRADKRYIYLLPIYALGLVWEMISAQHFVVHTTFTFKTLAVCIFAAALYLSYLWFPSRKSLPESC